MVLTFLCTSVIDGKRCEGRSGLRGRSRVMAKGKGKSGLGEHARESAKIYAGLKREKEYAPNRRSWPRVEGGNPHVVLTERALLGAECVEIPAVDSPRKKIEETRISKNVYKYDSKGGRRSISGDQSYRSISCTGGKRRLHRTREGQAQKSLSQASRAGMAARTRCFHRERQVFILVLTLLLILQLYL